MSNRKRNLDLDHGVPGRTLGGVRGHIGTTSITPDHRRCPARGPDRCKQAFVMGASRSEALRSRRPLAPPEEPTQPEHR